MTRDMGMNQTMAGHLKALPKHNTLIESNCAWECLANATYVFKSIVATITRGVYWLGINSQLRYWLAWAKWVNLFLMAGFYIVFSKTCKSVKKKSLRCFRNLGCLHSLPALRTYFKAGPKMELWGSLCLSSTLFEKIISWGLYLLRRSISFLRPLISNPLHLFRSLFWSA